jgi:hypothetical protein
MRCIHGLATAKSDELVTGALSWALGLGWTREKLKAQHGPALYLYLQTVIPRHATPNIDRLLNTRCP